MAHAPRRRATSPAGSRTFVRDARRRASAAPGRHRRPARAASRTWSTSSPAGPTLTVDLRNTDDERAAPRPSGASPTFVRRGRRGRGRHRRRRARWPASSRSTFDDRVVDLVERRRPPSSATRRCGCRRAPATTPRCWPGCARPGWSSCRACDGISHNPAEHTEPADLDAGADVLLHVLLRAGRGGLRSAVSARSSPSAPPSSGPIQRDDTREDVVERLLALLHQAADARVRARRLPRAGPHHVLPPLVRRRRRRGRPLLRDGDAERPTRSRCSTRPRRLGVGFCLGYAELDAATATATTARSSSSATARIVATYRKVHIPGHEQHEPDRPFQHLERYYFEPGPDGFGVWRAFGGVVGMMICNDRRWPETYRVMGLQGVELILCGYNTPIHYVPDPSQDVLQGFHNALVMQAGAYQNGTWVVGVAKGGVEEGVDSLGAELHHRPVGPDRRPGPHHRRRADRRPLRPRLVRSATRARCSTSTATAGPRSTAGSPRSGACRHHRRHRDDRTR